MNNSEELIEQIIKGIQEKKGSDIVVADLSGIEGTICKRFVVCQGNSPTQVEAIADSVTDTVREKAHEKPSRVVGLRNAQWVDCFSGVLLLHQQQR